MNMASSDSGDNSEIFDCSVCLHYMLDRNPRSLHCLHTFCEDCLIKLVKDEQISCPTCRKQTPTPGDDVKTLPVNFLLSQFKMMQVSSKTEFNKNDLCNVCKVHPVSFLCKQCAASICNICKKTHENIGRYQNHEVVKLFSHYICQKHQQFVSVMCMKCGYGLCVNCTMLDHEEHSEYFEDYWKGIKQLKNETKDLHESVKNDIMKLNEECANLKSKVYEISEMKKGFQQQAVSLQKRYSETEERIKIIETQYEGHDELIKSYHRSEQLCNDALQLVSIAGIDGEEYNICEAFKGFKEAAERARQSTEESCKLKFDVPMFVPHPFLTGDIPMVHPFKDGIQLIKREIVVDMKLTEAQTYNCKLAFVGNHLGCIINVAPCHVACFDQKGQLINKYFPHNVSNIHGFAVWRNKIFMAENNGVTILPLGHDGHKLFYEKTFELYSSILPINDTSLFIAEWKENGTLSKWSFEENKTDVVLTNLKKPSHMTMINTDNGPQYIVTLWGNHTINSYDEQWTLKNEIGGEGTDDGKLGYPITTAVTERGTIIVADRGNDRVSHFTLDGTFINNILTPSDGIKPLGVAYKYPYLWVSPHNNSDTQSLRCYRVRWC